MANASYLPNPGTGDYGNTIDLARQARDRRKEPLLRRKRRRIPIINRRVIGGEVTVWSERLDPAIMLATAFPRAAAAAERLWSPRAKDIVAETAAARVRLEELRCVLLDRGLGVSTLEGGNSEATNYSLPSRPAGPGPNC
jgi:hypothetical protein